MIIALSVCPLKSRAEITEDARNFLEEERIWEYAPEEINQEDIENLTNGNNYASFWNRVRSFLLRVFSLGIKDSANLLAQLCGLLLLGAVLRSMDQKSDQSVQRAFRVLILLTTSLIVVNAVEGAMKLAKETMEGTSNFLLASLPVSGMLLAMKGEIQRATLQGVSLQHAIAVISAINTHILAPLLRALLALTLAGSVTGNDLQSLCTFLTKFIKRCCLFLFTIMSAVLVLNNALASAADSVAMRSVRFAAGSFIPVVGNLVGEGARSIAAGLGLIRKECGVACILIIVYLMARPLIILAFQKLVLSAASSVGDILGDKECAGFLRGVLSVWDLFIAVLSFQVCYFIFSIALFLKGGGA